MAMVSFCVSPSAVTGGTRADEQCFAAAAGSKQPEKDEPEVLSEFPKERMIIDEAICKDFRATGAFASAAVGQEVMQALAGCTKSTILQSTVEESLSSVGCADHDRSCILSIIKGKALLSAQTAGNNSILRCTASGRMQSGLVAVAKAGEGKAAGCTVQDLEETDEFLIVASTHLLESLSPVQMAKIFENAASGPAGIALALLRHAAALSMCETANAVVLDVRGWVVSLAADSRDAEETAANDEVGNETGDAPNNATLASAIHNVNGGVTDATAGNGNVVPPKQDADAEGKEGTPTNTTTGNGNAEPAKEDGAAGGKEGGAKAADGKSGDKEAPAEEEIDPNAPWHKKAVGTAKKHWSTHKDAIMKFAKGRQKTASKDAKKLQSFLGKCGGGGKDAVLDEDEEKPVAIPENPVLPSVEEEPVQA